jgi:hypothetical protein
MFRHFLGHHQALQESKTKILNCLHMNPYYDNLSLLLQQSTALMNVVTCKRTHLVICGYIVN